MGPVGDDYTPPPRVAFGPEEYQTIPVEVASMLLTLWRDRLPAQFGSYLAEVLTGVSPRPDRKARG
jgi:hypothetical protein